ncbi:MAG: hypothetical protein QXK89_07340 [Candidatus Bathyarchaeia archaeon]
MDYVRRFVDYCFSLGLSAPRVYKYASTVAKISRLMRKDFMKVTRKDIEWFVASLERNKKISPWTKQNIRLL